MVKMDQMDKMEEMDGMGNMDRMDDMDSISLQAFKHSDLPTMQDSEREHEQMRGIHLCATILTFRPYSSILPISSI